MNPILKVAGIILAGIIMTSCSRYDKPISVKFHAPLKTLTFKYAKNFKVEVYENYKKVIVKSPWAGAQQNFSYILKNKNTLLDSSVSRRAVFNTPVNNIITFSNNS